MSDTKTIETQHTSGVYAKRDLTIVRGKGALLWDDAGNEYIDCVGAQGAANLGHAHPKIVQAIREQASQLISCPEMFYNPQRAALSARLPALAPGKMERVFLCNSGTETIEAAFKFAALYHQAAKDHRHNARLPRAHDGRTLGHLEQEIPRTFYATGARFPARALQ